MSNVSSLFTVGKMYYCSAREGSIPQFSEGASGNGMSTYDFYICSPEEASKGLMRKFVMGITKLEEYAQYKCISKEPLIFEGNYLDCIAPPSVIDIQSDFIITCQNMFTYLDTFEALTAFLTEKCFRHTGLMRVQYSPADAKVRYREIVMQYIREHFCENGNKATYLDDPDNSWVLWHLLIPKQTLADAVCDFCKTGYYHLEWPTLVFELDGDYLTIKVRWEGDVMTFQEFIESLIKHVPMNKQVSDGSISSLLKNAEG